MPRIFDCILLTDELDLLEERFRELEGLDVTHVIAESKVTYAGDPKPLHFQEERYGRFSPWYGRWTHVVISPRELPRASPRQRKEAMRDYLSCGLSGKRGDIILHGGTDEIPSAAAVAELTALPAVLEMTWTAAGAIQPDPWLGTAACGHEGNPGFSILRSQRHSLPVIHAGGIRKTR
jgi:Glycosyltransferase family 17